MANMSVEILSVEKIIEAFKANYPDTVFFWEHKTNPGWYVRTSQGPRKIKEADNEKKAYMSAIKYMNFTHDIAREYWKAKNSQPAYKLKREKPAYIKRCMIEFKKISKNKVDDYYIILTREKLSSLFGEQNRLGFKREEIERYVTTDWLLRKNKTVFVFTSAEALVRFCVRKNIEIQKTFSVTKVE